MVVHHIDRSIWNGGEPTFFLVSISAAFSARAFSWLLRFLRRLSGTRTWSRVGVELLVTQD